MSLPSMPSQIDRAHLQREQAPVVGIGPGDVHEVLQAGVWLALADEARAEVEVIVLEHDERLAARRRRWRRRSRRRTMRLTVT